MAYPARSISDISKRVRQAFREHLPGTDATIAQNVLYVFAKVQALLLKEFDLRLAWLYRQIFATTADEYHLERRHAAEFGIARAPASFAVGSIAVTGTPLAVIPANLAFLSAGVTYRSTDAATLSAEGGAVIAVKALTAGPRGNRQAGETLALADPGLVPQLAPSAVVIAIGGGAEKESVEALRMRILDRKRRPPQGGSESDYERWTTALAFVSTAWCRRLVGGPGAVGVWFLTADGSVPDAAEIAAVKAELEGRRLIGVRDLAVYAPVAVPLGVTVSVEPDTIDIRGRVSEAVARVIAARRRPGLPGADFVFSRSWIAEAIADVVGEDSHVLVAPAGDLTYGLGELPVFDMVTFA